MSRHQMWSFKNLPRYCTCFLSVRNLISAATRETVQGETNVKAIIHMLLVWGWCLVLTYETAKRFFGMSLEGGAASTVLWDRTQRPQCKHLRRRITLMGAVLLNSKKNFVPCFIPAWFLKITSPELLLIYNKKTLSNKGTSKQAKTWHIC